MQTYEGVAQAFDPGAIQGAQEEVQLREQDFGNFQACAWGAVLGGGGALKPAELRSVGLTTTPDAHSHRLLLSPACPPPFTHPPTHLHSYHHPH